MTYIDTFIQVAEDCPAESGVVPKMRGQKKSVALIQYELLSQNPYQFDYDALLYEVHVRHKGITKAEIAERGAEIREVLLAKNHPCLRASALPKRYGWGVHYDGEGKISIYGIGSHEYGRFVGENAGIKLKAMRNKRRQIV